MQRAYVPYLLAAAKRRQQAIDATLVSSPTRVATPSTSTVAPFTPPSPPATPLPTPFVDPSAISEPTIPVPPPRVAPQQKETPKDALVDINPRALATAITTSVTFKELFASQQPRLLSDTLTTLKKTLQPLATNLSLLSDTELLQRLSPLAEIDVDEVADELKENGFSMGIVSPLQTLQKTMPKQPVNANLEAFEKTNSARRSEQKQVSATSNRAAKTSAPFVGERKGYSDIMGAIVKLADAKKALETPGYKQSSVPNQTEEEKSVEHKSVEHKYDLLIRNVQAAINDFLARVSPFDRDSRGPDQKEAPLKSIVQTFKTELDRIPLINATATLADEFRLLDVSSGVIAAINNVFSTAGISLLNTSPRVDPPSMSKQAGSFGSAPNIPAPIRGGWAHTLALLSRW